MGLSGDEAEEVESECLVTLTKACQTYDASKGVPLANWLARNIRWSIQNMRRKNNRTLGRVVDFKSVTASLDDSGTELRALVAKAAQVLTPVELEIILAGAWGYKQSEIARKLNMSPVSVFRAKKKAREKLEKIRE